ncbi:MAG: hypothetical protein WCJ53_14340 [Mycobacteriaceae bacterium]
MTVVPGVAEAVTEEVAAGGEVSSAWAAPAPANATPTPRVNAPAPNHP